MLGWGKLRFLGLYMVGISILYYGGAILFIPGHLDSKRHVSESYLDGLLNASIAFADKKYVTYLP